MLTGMAEQNNNHHLLSHPPPPTAVQTYLGLTDPDYTYDVDYTIIEPGLEGGPPTTPPRRSQRGVTSEARVNWSVLLSNTCRCKSLEPGPVNKHRKKSPQPGPVKKMEESGVPVRKRCTHCGVQRTSLWRHGPEGVGTLCNACGLRYRSGQLLPEYRPAGSPSFSSELHSNSRQKVLKMRKMKETGQPDSGGSLYPVPVIGDSVDLHHPDPDTSAAGERITEQQPSCTALSDDLDSAAQRKPWFVKQDDDALYFMVDMPGVRKKDAKVSMEGSTLMVKGVRKLDPDFKDEETCPTTYVTKLTLLAIHEYDIAGIRAWMKDGVLKVKVPKVEDMLHI